MYQAIEIRNVLSFASTLRATHIRRQNTYFPAFWGILINQFKVEMPVHIYLFIDKLLSWLIFGHHARLLTHFDILQ